MAGVSLSVACITGGPGRRVAAVLEPLREIADEIVIAADARVGPERLAEYAGVADRVLRIRFEFLERHLAWLHAQCAGEWILRLDDDEVVSPGLLAALPGMLAATDVLQYRIPRRWLYPDPGHWLSEAPWDPDLQTRMVRTGPWLRFPGLLHTSVQDVLPGRVVEEPIYHLAHLTEDTDARRARAVRYEVLRPGLEAPGGGPLNPVYYVPEDWARRAPADVPACDLPAIVAALAGRHVSGPAPDDTVVPAAENDRHWAGAPVAASDRAAALAPVREHTRLAPGERGEVPVRVTNLGTVPWPWGIDQPPLIRPAHRWLDVRGNPVDGEHPREPLPCAIDAGATEIVPLHVHAPATAGEYLLEVDVVHEGVAWFGSAIRIPVTVAAREEPVATVPLPRRRGFRRGTADAAAPQAIPRVVHRIWLGAGGMPDEQRAFGEGWARINPGWEVRLWGDGDVEDLVSDPATYARARNLSERSDVLRYEILRRFGGVYADTDVECLRPFAPLLGGVHAFAGYEAPGRLGTALVGATPGHPLAMRAVAALAGTIGRGTYPDASGPVFLTAVARGVPDLVRFPCEVFYPYGHDEPGRRHERFRGAWAVHHWARSWG